MRNSTVIIRDRYQLTIPGQLRKYLEWIEPKRAVKIILLDKRKLLVEPYAEEKLDWIDIWRKIESIEKLGKKVNLSEFVVRDRDKH